MPYVREKDVNWVPINPEYLTTVYDQMVIGSGAKVLGPFRVGDNARIAAGAVVLTEVPENATAVGVPAKVVRVGGEKVDCASRSLDQIHYTDPVAKQLEEIETKLNELKNTVDGFENGAGI